ncbi:MAG TPA: YfcE family phosphodiesterase [Pontiella sp.]|nr:YfcE family phosphodiesterase [Pontiella sp.]
MKIGILSDTHGDRSAAAKAAEVFLSEGVEAVFHCGDIGGMDVLSELAGAMAPDHVPVHAVLGNVDFYSRDWKYFPSNIGVQLHGRVGDIVCAGRRIALLHSDDRRLFNETVSSGQYDLVFTGHSHEVHDYMRGRTRCINPGTAGRGAPDTCAVLDLESGELLVINI